MKNLIGWTLLLVLLFVNVKAQVIYSDDFSNPSIWSLNATPASVTPAQGANDPAYNPWVINALDYFTPSGPISGNSMKITIQPGTDFDGFGLSANYAGYDPFNVSERNITDAIAVMSQNINTSGYFGITLEFDYQTGGWLGDDYGTVLYSTNGGASWTELDNSYTVTYSYINMNNQTLGFTGSDPAAPPNAATMGAFSNIDGFSSGTLWHRASVLLPPACDNIAGLRLGFRWRNIDHLSNSPDYVGVSFNVDNISLVVDPPVADFTWNPDPVCIGTAATFDPSASDPGGGASITGWIWTFSNGTPSTSTAQNPAVTWSAGGMETVTLQVINNNGDTSAVESQYIFIADCRPEPNFLSTNTVCIDSVITFTDFSSNMTGAYAPLSWSWTFPGGSPATANTQGPHNVTFASSGPVNVNLSVTNAYGTRDTTITISVVDCSCGALSAGGVVYSEDFDGNGGAGSRWAVLNSDIGGQGQIANQWYISGAECGVAPPGCGTSCGGDFSLHVSGNATWSGDIGAAYEIGAGFCGSFPAFCPLTDRRSYSVNINTTGFSGMTMDFNYIENGQGATDNAICEYSTNGGTSWVTLVDMPKTPLCGVQGRWTAFSIPLPAACENISNLKIGFRWWNNDDGLGTDPSFAVDDIVISSGGGSPPQVWEGDISDDWHVAGNWSTNTVPTAADNVLVPSAAALTSFCGGCVMPHIYNGNAVALDVCNYGTITIHDTPIKRTLSVNGALLNEGAITTTSIDPQYDVLMVGASSTYAGSGTNIDTDYQIQSGMTTLLSNLSCRSFQISANFDWDIYTITVKRNFYRTTGTITTTTSSTLLMDGPGSGLDTNPSQQLGSNVGITIPNYIVNKPSGIVTLSTGAAHSISQRMTIIQGIVDAGTGQITGAGDLYMYAGQFLLARTGTTVPQITGSYVLTGGLIRLYGAGAQTLRGARDYYDLEFTGTGIKTLGGNDQVQDSLFFNLPLTPGNYVNANGFTLWHWNTDPGSVQRTGGHVWGNFRRNILSSGVYRWYVGSDNVGTVTYYEPMDIQPVGLTGTNDITVAFNKNAPNPLTVSPPLTEYGATFTDMETEGYWEVNPNAQPTGGTFTVTQYPSPAWIFSNVSYTQVRQDNIGLQWNWNGSTRVTALKRKDYPSFSNFGIASSNDPLPVAGLVLKGVGKDRSVDLDWSTAVEVNTSYFEVERSANASEFNSIGDVAAGGNLPDGAKYSYTDYAPELGMNYYRIREVDNDGRFAYSNTIMVLFGEDAGLVLYPNPARNQVNIQYSGTESVELIMTDALGRVVSTDVISQNKTIDVSGYARGVYLVTLKLNSGKTWSQKLVLK